MADAAAFFAKKKKKKKAFKFNANKIDASTVTNTVHVDAPALSTETDAGAIAATAADVADSTTQDVNNAEQWDDEALAANTARKGTAVAPTTSAELLDMKALDLKRSEEGDIAEKLRVEETKAQLAAAKAGMEKEAQRLKEEREKKEQAKEEVENNKPRFGAAAAGMAGGGKWVPPHMRSGGGMLSAERLGAGVSASQRVDTQDENLFPDLASADALLKQKQNEPVYKAPKKTPVGGGATWGNRPKLNLQPKKAEEKEGKTEKEEAVSQPPPTEKAPESTVPAPAPKPAPAPAAAPKQPIKPKKKKKKDLSTFKSSS